MTRTILALLLLVAAELQSQSAPVHKTPFDPRFELFTLPGGESANNVQCIVQDRVGFLWFASAAGLHRYDGQHITTYHHDPLDSTSIDADYLEWIYAGRDGTLWLGYWGHGLSAFDPVTEKCAHFRHDPANPASLSSNYISTIIEDQKGFIWVGTLHGLNRLDRTTGQFRRFMHDSSNEHSLSYDDARSLFVDKAGTLWVGCGISWDPNDPQGVLGGLNRYHSNGTFTRYLHDPKDPYSLADNRVRAIFEDSKGRFWIGTAGGLQQMDRQQGTFTKLPFDPAQPNHPGGPVLQRNVSHLPRNYHISFISEDHKGRLWIGASEGGLNVYDPSTNATRHFEKAEGMIDSLQANTVWQFCQTHDGVIWLGSGTGGWSVYRVKNSADLFPFYETNRLGLGNITVTGMLEDTTGKLWIQTIGDFTGVLKLDRKSGKCQRFSYEPPVENRSFLNFFKLGTDPLGNIWAATENGLYKLDVSQANQGAGKLQLDSSIANATDFRLLWPPYFDRRGNAWIGTFGNGLYCFDPQMKEFTHFRHDPADPHSLGGDQVEKVFEDKQGRLWVHGGGIGIDPAHPLFFDRYESGLPEKTGSFTHLIPAGEMGDPACSLEDKDGNFWFNAYPYGLRKLNPYSGEYRSFTVANGTLTSNAIADMLLDQDGHIWLLSSDAIIELDPKTELFFTYTVRHGVHPFSFSFFTGSCRGPDGELFLGGVGGFHAFFPEEVHRLANESPPAIRLTGLKVLGKEQTPGRSDILSRPIWETEEIRLGYRNNVFSLNMTCFDFNGPELSRLEYRLENYDRTWRNDLLKGEATYVNVPPGKYLFRVRGSNSMGAWNYEGRSLYITILPPWWRTWWAYAMYGLVLAASMYSFHHFQLNRRLAVAEFQRMKELDAFKTELYTNITHEFRTPLTIILGMADQLLNQVSEGAKMGLQMIQRNGLQLLRLVNQILDLRKLESGKMLLSLQQGDVIPYLRYILESFHSFAESKEVGLHFSPEKGELVMDYDADKLLNIVSNLLSNALKFTLPGGNVYLSVNEQMNPAPFLILKVKDEGIGIPAKKLPFIFDRFYQAGDQPSAGSGIGLALTRELVRLQGGEISVQSEIGKGTVFTVILPITKTSSLRNEAGTPSFRDTAYTFIPTEGNSEMKTLSDMASEEKPIVLLVDDNSDVITYLQTCLNHDYRLATAKDGRRGIDQAFAIIPDMIICDIMMPEIDGLTLVRTLKNDIRTSHIPIILLTAKADQRSKISGLTSGADAYLAKPFDREELIVTLKKGIELRKKLQSHYSTFGPVPPTRDERLRKEYSFLKRMNEILEANLEDENFGITETCQDLGISRMQLFRKLKALTDKSASDYIRSYRLQKARMLIEQTDLNISEVAFRVGFKSAAYFSTAFSEEFGKPPSVIRRNRPKP